MILTLSRRLQFDKIHQFSAHVPTTPSLWDVQLTCSFTAMVWCSLWTEDFTHALTLIANTSPGKLLHLYQHFFSAKMFLSILLWICFQPLWVISWKMPYEYTRPRGPIAAQYSSPGPCYALPSLIGAPTKDGSQPNAPAYHFGLKWVTLTIPISYPFNKLFC